MWLSCFGSLKVRFFGVLCGWCTYVILAGVARRESGLPEEVATCFFVISFLFVV